MEFYKPNTKEIRELLAGKIKLYPISEKMVKTVGIAWDKTAKPLDSLGKFESITKHIGGILNRADFDLKKRAILSFCADNGVVNENISQSGQDITRLVAIAMGQGTSSVAKMAKLSGTDFFPIDVGINYEEKIENVEYARIANGTKNFANEAAMSKEELIAAMAVGYNKVKELKEKGYELLGIGEMGIGNTTTTSAVASALLNKNAVEMTGPGAGLSKDGVVRKAKVIQNAIDKYDLYSEDTLEVLRHVGGFDIAAMTGVVLGGAVYGLPIVLDGVISAVAALSAEYLLKGAGKRCIPSHLSREHAAGIILDELGLSPFIMGDMALGEGTGACMLFSLFDHAMAIYATPTSFEDMNIEAYTRFE